MNTLPWWDLLHATPGQTFTDREAADAARTRELALPPGMRMPAHKRALRDTLLTRKLLRYTATHTPPSLDRDNAIAQLGAIITDLTEGMNQTDIDHCETAARQLFAWTVNERRKNNDNNRRA